MTGICRHPHVTTVRGRPGYPDVSRIVICKSLDPTSWDRAVTNGLGNLLPEGYQLS